MRSLILAQFTFKEAIRKKMVLGVVLLSIAFIVLYAYGFHSLKDNFDARQAAGEPSPFRFELFASLLILLGLYVVNFLSGVLAIFAAVGSIASEIDAGTFHAIVPKPIHRWEIVFGKWLGFAWMLIVYVALMCVAMLLVSRYIGEFSPPNAVPGVALIVLVSLLLLSLTVLGSTFFASLTNGIIVFMLYGVALLGGMVGQIGNVLTNHTLINIGTAVSFLIPSDAIWKLASYWMEPSNNSQFALTLFTTTTPPSTGMIVYAVLYVAAAVALSTWIFSRRDL